MSNEIPASKIPLVSLAPALWTPEYFVGESAWIEHAPFAFWLVDVLRPRNFVELGAHSGYSYFCFCQAVQRLNLGTACHAVDAWTGDEHAGFYGEEVFQSVARHNDRYSAFSTLLRMTFDDARRHFPDRSVDLLHIDGRHYYADVRHDFEAWRDKLTDDAIVLFHDTEVRERDFGVWKLFEELKREHATFEFTHGYGLGVLAVKTIPGALRSLFDADEGATREWRHAFASLGGAVSEMGRLRQTEAQLLESQRRLKEANERAEAKMAVMAEKRAVAASLARRTVRLRGKRSRLEKLWGRIRATAQPKKADLAILRRSLFLDEEWYLAAYPDVAAAGTRPAEHYAAFGADEGRDPGPFFSTRDYLANNSDVAKAGLNPLLHFEKDGWREKRALFGTELADIDRPAIDDVTAGLPALREPVAEKDAQIVERSYSVNRTNALSWSRFRPWFAKKIRASRGLRRRWTTAKIKAAPSLEAIALPVAVSNPDVSVVILSFGHVDYTLRCLDSIAEHPPLSSVEIIVSDDRSGAQDLEKLTKGPNLRFLQPPENLGFLKHANWAVAQSTGKYVLLLNNDTEVKPGAIDALVETARTTPNAGLVGSKLVYPDGRLQEAGGIVWNDASAWNYGHFDDPDKPEYNYLRDADYISGASILLPRAVWDRLGGFDEVFAPAYCEDSDLAFRVRQSGLRVIYQPESVVVHYEGVTHGTDINSGVKAFQAVNQKRLKERWLPTLQAGHFPNGEHVARARDRSKNRRVMLIIDHYVPEPDRDAGSRTMIEVIKSLQAEGWVIKFWPDNLRYDPVYTPKLQRMGVETLYRPWVTSFDNWISANKDDIDLIFLSRPTVARNFVSSIRKIVPLTPTIFYGHDLHFERMRLQACLTNDTKLAAEADAMESLERALWNSVDLVLYPSQDEINRVQTLESTVVARTMAPYCFETFVSRERPPATPSLIFVAGFAHAPNVDAAVWFVERILPLVRRDVPQVKLSLVGSNPTDRVRALSSANVEVTGFVTEPDLAKRYADARVAVAPLRFGAGVKLKVVEAMQMGLPLVTTTVGSQGLPGITDIASVHDEPDAIARACVTLLQDDLVWRKQSAAQVQYVRSAFSAQAMRTSLTNAIASITTRMRS